MNLQHINLKLWIDAPQTVKLESFVPVFHRWIQAQNFEELLIDVANYAHVPAGPGVLLIGHEAHFSIDNADNALGLLYNRKTVLEGTNLQKLKQATERLLQAANLLTHEASLKPALKFDSSHWQLMINDRMIAPNQISTFSTLEPELKTFFSSLFGNVAYQMTRHEDPRERFTLDVTVASRLSLEELSKNLESIKE